jgi:DNA-binding transcriptional MerR regulator
MVPPLLILARAKTIESNEWFSLSLHITLLGCVRPIKAHHFVDPLHLERAKKKEGAVKNLISIGQFSKLAELSIRALRLYDELDVLKPVFIDPDTNYRRYGLEQVGTAQQIRAMRQFDVPLPTIRKIIGDPVLARDNLQRHRQVVYQKLEVLESKLRALDRLIRT